MASVVTDEELAAVLRHCRALAAMADELHGEAQRWGGVADAARARWRGPSADEFATRHGADAEAAAAVVALLRAEADGWAQAWADAVNQHRARQWAEASTAPDAGVMIGQGLVTYTPVPPPRAETGYAPTGDLSGP